MIRYALFGQADASRSTEGRPTRSERNIETRGLRPEMIGLPREACDLLILQYYFRAKDTKYMHAPLRPSDLRLVNRPQKAIMVLLGWDDH